MKGQEWRGEDRIGEDRRGIELICSRNALPRFATWAADAERQKGRDRTGGNWIGEDRTGMEMN